MTLRAASANIGNQWDLLIMDLVLPEYNRNGGEFGELIWNMTLPDENVIGGVKLELECEDGYFFDVEYLGMTADQANNNFPFVTSKLGSMELDKQLYDTTFNLSVKANDDNEITIQYAGVYTVDPDVEKRYWIVFPTRTSWTKNFVP